jgi:hypothetical protein
MARCSTNLRTSPGFEICDRSILGLNSSAGAAGRELRPLPGSACSAKYFFTRSASSTSIELECVFFSVTPTLTRASRIALLFTSSSRARSLIRIFCMPPCFLRIVDPVRTSWHPHGKYLPSATPTAGPVNFYLFSPGSSSSGMFSLSVVGRSCVVTSATSASGVFSMPSTTSAS